MNRKQYAALIKARIEAESDRMRLEFSENRVQSCSIDNLLPEELALEIFEAFPDKSSMILRKSLRENKHVAAQMDHYKPILEEIIYAFKIKLCLT